MDSKKIQFTKFSGEYRSNGSSPQLRRRESYRLDTTGIGNKKNKILYRYKQVRGSKLTLRMSDQTKRPPLKRRIADVSKILTTHQQIKSLMDFSQWQMEMNWLFIFTWRYPSENECQFVDGAGISARKFDSSKLELDDENSNLDTSVSFGSYEATRSTLRS